MTRLDQRVSRISARFLLFAIFALAAISFGCAKRITLIGGSGPYCTVVKVNESADSVIAGQFELYYWGTSFNEKYCVGSWDFRATPERAAPDFFDGPANRAKEQDAGQSS